MNQFNDDDPSKKFQRLRDLVVDLQQSALDMRLAFEELHAEIGRQKYELETQYNLSPILESLERVVEAINIDTVTDFTNDVEEAVNDLPYKLKKSYTQHKLTVNPLFKNTPVYFDAMYPADPQEHYQAKDEDLL